MSVAKIRVVSGTNTPNGTTLCVSGRTAETAATYLDKGRQVYVEGRIQTRNYEKDGQTHYRTEVVANVLQFLGGRDDVGSSAGSGGYNRSSAPKPQPSGGFSDIDSGNDIPF